MKFTVKREKPGAIKAGCVVLGVFERRKLSAAATEFDASTDGLLTELIKLGDMDGKCGQTALLHFPREAGCERVLLVGCGKQSEFNDKRYSEAVFNGANALNASGTKDAATYLTELEVTGRDTYWKIRRLVEITIGAMYSPGELKSEKDIKSRHLRAMAISASADEADAAHRAIRDAAAISDGVTLARTLGDLPANICTPKYLAEQAKTLARDHDDIKVSVLDESDMKKLGMGALLSVARGSREPARLVCLEYRGASKSSKPVVLVGKGVTFDSGGISIKPAQAMDEMKFDMCGAASVLGTFKACTELRLPLNVVGLIPTTENLPDGNASKPGDIVTSMSGQTIEVLNTDAEGRLILCDALTYAKKYDPDVVVDIATLTGACVIALGSHAAGLLGNDAELSQQLLAAGDYAGDRAWQLPLWEDYQPQLDSNFADMANVGGREAGTITAACFLSRFAKEYRWAHLDIAGVAWKQGKEKGATGRPVPLLTQFLLERCRTAR